MGQFGGNVTLEQLETKKSDADTSNYLRPTVENVEDLVPFDERGGREWYDPLVSSQTERRQAITGPLIRAARGERRAETRESILDRSEELQSKGFSPSLLGAASTAYGIVSGIGNLVSGAVNVGIPGLGGYFSATTDKPFSEQLGITGPDTGGMRTAPETGSPILKKRAEYERYYENRQRELIRTGSSDFSAWFETNNELAWKMFKDAPELPSTAVFIQGLSKMLFDVELTAREADEFTGFWRPEATLAEQVVRSIPEAYAVSGAAKMFATRAGNPLLIQSQKTYNDIRKAKGKKTQDISKIDEKDLNEVVTKAVNERYRGSKVDGFRGKILPFRKRGFTRRMSTVLNERRMPVKINKIDEEIQIAKGKLAAARSIKDKSVIRLEERKIRQLGSDRLLTTPHEFRSIAVSEAWSQAGGILVGNWFGSSWAWVGYLGGGLAGGIGHDFLVNRIDGISNSMGRIFGRLVDDVGDLSEEEFKSLIKNGRLPEIEGMSSLQKESLEEFANMLKGLPDDLREQMYGNLKFFKDTTRDLTALGVDPEKLQTTMGKAMGMIPLMVMRNAISAAKLDTSKGFKGLGNDLEHLIKEENAAKNQLVELRKLMNDLAGKAENVNYNNEQFNSFVKAMNELSGDMARHVDLNTANIQKLVDDFAVAISDPDLARKAGLTTPEKIQEAIEAILEHEFTKGRKDESVEIIMSMGIDLRKTGKAFLKMVQDRARSTDGTLDGLANLNDPQKYRIAAEEAGERLAHTINTDYATRSETAAQAYKMLEQVNVDNPIQVDISKWLRSLYAADDFTDEYTVPITQTIKGKLAQAMTQKKLPDSNILRVFSDVEAKKSINDLLQGSQELRQHYANMIDGAVERGIIEQPVTPDGELINDTHINHTVLKSFYQELWGESLEKAGRGRMSDFDLWLTIDNDIRGVLKSLDFPTPVINVRIHDVNQIAEALKRRSKDLYKTQRAKSFRYDEMRDELFHQVKADEKQGKEVVEAINLVKDNWINHVWNRYRNKELNPLGYRVSETAPVPSKMSEQGNKIYLNNPHTWVDINEIMDETAGEAAADRLLDQLRRTFGDYDTNINDYVLTEANKTELKPYLDALLHRHISSRSEVSRAAMASQQKGTRTIALKEHIRPIDPNEMHLDTVIQKEILNHNEIEEAGLEEIKKRILDPLDVINSPGLNRLEQAGVLNKKQVNDYNMDIKTHLGRKGTIATEQKRLAAEIKSTRDELSSVFNVRRQALQELIKGSPVTAVGKTKQQEELYEFFVSAPQGLQRMDEIAEQFAKKMGITTAESKEIMGDIVIEGLTVKTRGKQVAETTVPGEFVEGFDYKAFYTEVQRNKEALQYIVGEEKFYAIEKLANFMTIISRSPEDQLSEIAVRLKIPTGLSLESYISRAYSIFRGIISPKYVATEVALLHMRKKHASALAEILKDPKAIDAVIALLEHGGEITTREHGKILTAVMTSLANFYYEQEPAQRQQTRRVKKVEEQMELIKAGRI